MDEHVCAHVAENFDGVKGIVTGVVVAQCKVDLAGDARFPCLWMEAHVDVSEFQDGHRLVGLNRTEVNVAHANADAAFVLTAGRVVVRLRVVVQGLAAIRLFRAPRRVRVGEANGIRCGDACQRQVTGIHEPAQQGRRQASDGAEGVADVEGNPFDAHAQPNIVRGLGEARVHHHGIGFRVGQRDVKRQALHHRHLKVLKVVPQGIVDVHGADFPLEGGLEPNFRGCGNETAARLNAPTLTEGRDALDGQGNGQIVCTVAIDVDVVLKQDEVGANQQLPRKRARIPRLVRRAVVARGEIHVHSVGVDAKTEQVVQPKRIHGKERLPQVVRPRIGMGRYVGQEGVWTGVVFFHGGGVSQFNTAEVTFRIGQGITGRNGPLGSIKHRKGRLGPLQGDKRLTRIGPLLEGLGQFIQHAEVVTRDRKIR